MDDETGFAGTTVLVADGDAASREGTRAILAPYGYDIRVAGDGVTAWSIALGVPLDLAVIDLNLAGLSGFDLLARLKLTAETADVPVVVLSGDDSAALCNRAFGLGATMYLTRPLHAAQLAHLAWYVLRNGRRDAEMRTLRARLAGSGSPTLAMVP